MRALLRTAAAAATAAAVLAGAAACADHRERTPAEAFLAASRVMRKAGAARVALQRQDPGQGAVGGRGVLSWGGRPAMDLVLRGPSGTTEVRTLDGTVHLGPDGGDWTEYDPEDPAAGGPGAAAAAVYSTWSEQLDPVADLEALAEVGTLERIGTERVGGDDAVHYRGTATVRALVGASGGLPAAQRVSVLGAYLRQGATGITADVWINGRDEVVQERKTWRMPRGAATTTTRYTDLGTEVDIQAPLPGETVDAAKAEKDATG
ncbi:hypothetical protein [Streptomyces sp. NPDC001380]|uniref:hypothetical protein n=1 Tax=Streptomyces sp. NPDC001380 TaxID=3364566 RepID=UPI0036952DC2